MAAIVEDANKEKVAAKYFSILWLRPKVVMKIVGPNHVGAAP